ncbi:MAG: LysR family transcriptional regulator [Egibacteraceae bacterium]
MRTGDLDALRAAAAAGSLTAAAQALGCSQPGLSRRLQRLEADLGTRLLQRSTAGVQLTVTGARVLVFAEEILDAVTALRGELDGHTAPLHGTVRIVASTTPGDYVVPHVVARFNERYPSVSAELIAADSAAVPGTLLEHRADIGFAGRKNPDRRLTYVAVASDEIVLAVPTGHPLAGTDGIALDALAGERLIWREDGSGTQRTFCDAVAAAGEELPAGSSTLSVGSSQAVVSAVAAGLGIGVVSVRAVAAHPGQVVAVRVAGMPVVRRLWLVYETDRRRPAHLAAFIAYAADSAQV